MKTIGRLAASFDRRLPVVAEPCDFIPSREFQLPVPGTKHATPEMRQAFDDAVLSRLSSARGPISLRALSERLGSDTNKTYKSLRRLEGRRLVFGKRNCRSNGLTFWIAATITTGEQA